MAETLGQAVLELTTDDKALLGGINRAKVEAEGLQSTFNRTSAGIGTSLGSAGAAASQMAAQAQASGRAAMGMAAGFEASAGAARLNTIAMRETLVVARELARGNFTRLPGSLSLLAANTTGGLSGFMSGLAQSLGLVKTLQNAELAEEATNASAAAEAVRSAARVAAAKVLAADAGLALAEAEVRNAEGAEAEAAAQARLAAAHDAVAAAAAEATIAEDALASAEGAANEAGAAARATAVTSLTVLGTAATALSVAAGLALAGFEGFKLEVKDSGELDQFAEGLRLTSSQIEKAGGEVKYLSHNVEEVTGLTITWGDVARGTFAALAEAAGMSSSEFAGFWREAFLETAQVGVSAAQVIAGAFAAAASVSRNIQGLALAVVAPGNPLAGAAGIQSPEKIGQDALNAFKNQFSATGNFFHQTLPNDVLAAAHARLQKLSDRNNPPKPPKPEKEKRNPAEDELAKLDAEIKGQDELASAFLGSDAAAIKAQADQKALTLAVEKHATAAQTATLKEKELALAIATGSAEGAKHVAALRDETEARKTVNDMVAAGIIPASQAEQQLQLETELRPLLALKILAHGKALAQLNEIIQQTVTHQAELYAETSRLQGLKDIAANDDEIAKLALENSLMGVSNKERAVAIAQLEAIQKLNSENITDPLQREMLLAQAFFKAQLGALSPFQQWAQQVPQDAAAITEAFQGIEVKGIDGISSAIAGVVTGTESLKQAFSQLAQSFIGDIVQMIAKMLIFRALSSAFPGLFGGGGFGTSNFAGMGSGLNFGTDFSALPVPHFAGGGFLSIGGNGGVDRNLLSINGQPRAMVGADETLAVIPPGGGVAANSNQPAKVEIYVSGDDLWQLQVGQISNAVVDLKTPSIVGKAKTATMRSVYKKKIGS